jgi:hypothetical protein
MAAQTNAPFGFEFCGMMSGMPAPSLAVVITGSNVTLAEGDPIYLSGGYGYRCLTTEAPFAIAGEAITGSAGVRQSLLATPVVEGMIFRAQSQTTAACSQANVGVTYGMAGASGLMGLSLAVTTGSPWRIIRIDPLSAAGTYTIFQVMAAESQYSGKA